MLAATLAALAALAAAAVAARAPSPALIPVRVRRATSRSSER
ncbi:MAG: hypothetical protein ABW219_01055 [Ilumatobacteraceae bacterium]